MNVHDIRSIVVNIDGEIVDAYVSPEIPSYRKGWLDNQQEGR